MSWRTSIGTERLVDAGQLEKRHDAISGHPGFFASGSVEQRHVAERVVHEHGDEKQDPDDEARPVGVEAGVVDALVDDRECERAEDDADDRAVSAGQQHAADDHRDDRVEDERLARRHLGAVVEDRLAHADEGGARGRSP